MGIASCYTGTCGEVVDVIIPTYEGRYTRKTLKRMLPTLMVKELSRKLRDYPKAVKSKESKDELVRILPSQLSELIGEMNAYCIEHQCRS
jgi:hypothetical protein